MSFLPDANRVLAAVMGLLLFTLNDVRMFHGLPRAPDPAHAHALTLQVLGAAEPVYAAVLDIALRWGLAGLTIALCLWALAETIGPAGRRLERP